MANRQIARGEWMTNVPGLFFFPPRKKWKHGLLCKTQNFKCCWQSENNSVCQMKYGYSTDVTSRSLAGQSWFEIVSCSNNVLFREMLRTAWALLPSKAKAFFLIDYSWNSYVWNCPKFGSKTVILADHQCVKRCQAYRIWWHRPQPPTAHRIGEKIRQIHQHPQLRRTGTIAKTTAQTRGLKTPWRKWAHTVLAPREEPYFRECQAWNKP